jgi:sugar phosphate isomerase/epimerase
VTSPLSVQLYTLREAMAADMPGTLQRLADLGFTQVEPFGFGDRAAEYTAAIRGAGLTAPSTHTSLLSLDDAALDTVFAAASEAGIGTLIDPFSDPARWTDRAEVSAIAASLNRIAGRAAGAGLRVGYHNHHFELASSFDGTPALEVLATELDDAVVLEVDTYWVEVGGISAPELLQRLGSRVQFLHIKDGDKSEDTKKQVAVGSGSVPIREILAAAPQALPVVELDDFDGDMWSAVEESYRFLTTEVSL